MSSDLTKILLLPSGFVGCTKNNPSACKLSLSSNRITSTVPMYINNCQVMYADGGSISYDPSSGRINANILQVQGYDVLRTSGVIASDPRAGWITCPVLNTNSLNLTNNPNITIDSSGGNITAKSINVANPDITIDSNNGVINAKSILLNGQALSATTPTIFDGENINYDATTKTLFVKKLIVTESFIYDPPDMPDIPPE